MFFRTVYKSGKIFLPFCHNAHVWRTDKWTDGRTDRQTDRILIARPRLHCMQRGKNRSRFSKVMITNVYICICVYTVFQETWCRIFAITSLAVNRFWKFFHRWKQQWIMYNIIFSRPLKTLLYYRVKHKSLKTLQLIHHSPTLEN